MSDAAAAPLRYLALGDSYTIGEGVPAGARWPERLAAALRGKGLALAPPRILAATGWTSQALLAALDAAELDGRWDLVSLLIGVNDQYRGRPPADYGRDFAALLERALALAGGRAGRVLAISIPDWGVTPFARAEGRAPARIAAQIDTFNAEARAVCRPRQVAFVDITALTRQASAAPGGLAADALHPSAAQYEQWAERLLPIARPMLAGR